MSKKTNNRVETMKKLRFALVPMAMAAVVAPIAGAGCGEDSVLGDLAAQCGLVCPAEGILEGNASISGNASIDAFFGAVVDFQGTAKGIQANMQAQLDAMAATLGLEAGASIDDVKAALQAKISANVSGGISVKFQEPKCSASVEVTAQAAASCDASVDPGSVNVQCEGSCTIDASAQASCSASGTLTCKGQAPNLACSGTCTGDCTLDVAATCEGTCRGTCNGTCSVTDSTGACKGKCEGGTCQGTCELTAGGSCSGSCEGSCEYTPPSGSCDASAEAKCTGSASADVKCKGGCEGSVKPPQVKAECEASVKAKADASVECTPPSLEITWQWAAGVDAAAQADFRAFIGNFKGQFSAMLAAAAKADIMLEATANLLAAADGAVKAGIDVAATGDLKASIGAACALTALADVPTSLDATRASLETSASILVGVKGGVGL